MDYSSYPEDNQLQHYDYEYQQQQRQHQSYQYQMHQSSQIQPYYDPQHQYPYYTHNNYHDANSYAQQLHPIQPPGVPLPPPNVIEAHHADSHVAHFSGNFPVGQTPNRGGRKGNRPSRGGRGNLGRHASSFHGRGGGDGRHLGLPLPHRSQPLPASVAMPLVPTAAPQHPSRLVFCEVCQVDCNSQEMLKQHKNGKKHKKKLEKLNGKTNVVEQKNAQMPGNELKSGACVHPEKVDVTTHENSSDTDLEHGVATVGNSSSSNEEPKGGQGFPFVNMGRGGKRKMRGGGRGGKYIRGDEGSRVPVELPMPKQVLPFVCELCNAKCDTQAVFNTHLAGKKHQSNFKRFHSNPNYHHSSASLAPQGVDNDPQVILANLLMTYVLSQSHAHGSSSSITVQNQPDSNQIALAAEIRHRLQSLIGMSNGAALSCDTSSGAVNEFPNNVAATNMHDVSKDGLVSVENSSVSQQDGVTVLDNQALPSQIAEPTETKLVDP